MLVVSGEATPAARQLGHARQRPRYLAAQRRAAGRVAARAPRRATRRPSATAPRRRGAARQAHGPQHAHPLEADAGRPPAARRPTPCRRCRSRCRRRSRRPPGRSRRARPGTPPGARGGAARRSGRTPSSSSACLVDRYSGCRSCATTSGSTANSRWKCSMPSRKDAQRLLVLEVADVVAHPGARALGHAEGVLQLRAAGEQRRAAAAAAPSSAGTYPRERRSSSGRRAASAPRSRRCACGSAGRAAGTGRRSRPAARSASASS